MNAGLLLLDPEEAAFTDEERDLFFARVAREVCRRGMEVPAVLALELHRPLTFMGSQVLAIFTPMLAPAFGWTNLQKLYRLMEDRTNLDRLLEAIEATAQAGRGAPNDEVIQDLRKDTARG